MPNTTPTNLIQQILVERANLLLRQLENAAMVPHDQTAGELRETAIASSLRQIMPTGLEICSGFVTDAFGTTSPQLDIVVYQRAAVAPIFLQHDDAVIPFEAFKMAIEVKSTLRTSDFKQLETQSDSLAKMWNSTHMPQRQGGTQSTTLTFRKPPPPILVFAYDNKVSEDTLLNLVANSDSIIGIFIVKQSSILKSPTGVMRAKEPQTDIDRILFAWSTIFNACIDMLPFVKIEDPQMTQLRAWFATNRPELQLDDPSVVQRIFTPSISPYLFPQLISGGEAIEPGDKPKSP